MYAGFLELNVLINFVHTDQWGKICMEKQRLQSSECLVPEKLKHWFSFHLLTSYNSTGSPGNFNVLLVSVAVGG